MAAQASREQRLAVADIVIDNSGSLDDLDRRVGEVWADLERRAAAYPARQPTLRRQHRKPPATGRDLTPRNVRPPA